MHTTADPSGKGRGDTEVRQLRSSSCFYWENKVTNTLAASPGPPYSLPSRLIPVGGNWDSLGITTLYLAAGVVPRFQRLGTPWPTIFSHRGGA